MQKIQSAPDRRWAKDVAPGDEIRALYLIGSASQLQAKNGPFWRIELKDASGDLEARIWSPLSQQFAEIPSGVIAEVEGRAESFRDKLQVNVNALRVLSPEETASVDTSAFMASSSRSLSLLIVSLLPAPVPGGGPSNLPEFPNGQPES